MATPRKKAKRAPLMESDTEQALRRRGSELIGIFLLGFAALATAMIWTYSPDDPSLFSATDDAPRNALGLLGASLADPLHRASAGPPTASPLAFAVWGLRFVLHSGERRVARPRHPHPGGASRRRRLRCDPRAARELAPEYGLGGLLGDAVLGSVLSTLPFDVTLSLRIVAVALAAAFVVGSAYALGVSWTELRGFLRFVGQGSVAALFRCPRLDRPGRQPAPRMAPGPRAPSPPRPAPVAPRLPNPWPLEPRAALRPDPPARVLR